MADSQRTISSGIEADSLRTLSGIATALTVGLVAIMAPILLAIVFSRHEGLADESKLTLRYAQEVLHRTDDIAGQMVRGNALMLQSGLAPCSPAGLDLMRRIDISSSYVQGVGYVQDDQIICTSQGSTKPMPIGPPHLVTASGASEWLNVVPPFADHGLLIFAKDKIAYFLDMSLAVDIPAEGPNIATAIFVPSLPEHPLLIAQNGTIPAEWFHTPAPGGSTTFRTSDHVVAITRSKNTDVAVIAAAPVFYANAHARKFALIFVPIGLVCAGLLTWAVLNIAQSRFSLPSVLRTGAKRKEFFLQYQPVVELNTRRVIGAEALVRWKKSRRVIRPEHFMAVAEESEVITQMTACIFEIVAADIADILRIQPDFFIAINLSTPDLRAAQTAQFFRKILGTGKVQPHNLVVEATERGFLQSDETKHTLESLRQLGVAIAIDDFGTGYSSLSCLQNLRLNILKIDKSFVETIGTDAATNQIVPHIIDMAHSLEICITAEGVETEEQAKFLRDRGVQHAQGWLFGQPLYYIGLKELLRRQRTAAERH
ncbi:EAL domain-containing protein [Terriglobus sp. TAA 43]|uniref:EAL domain-containing protein n=1 Tax=Terriglobus sp. TAA 43 TaxID=278961 RepID=UPI000647F2CD|nr:EAL domain-containing protein [Terriglobus sp. TAA 43]